MGSEKNLQRFFMEVLCTAKMQKMYLFDCQYAFLLAGERGPLTYFYKTGRPMHSNVTLPIIVLTSAGLLSWTRLIFGISMSIIYNI